MSNSSAKNLKVEQEANQISQDKFRSRKRAYCLLCEKPVELIDFETAAKHLDSTIQELVKLADGNNLHKIHNSKAIVMICSTSLFCYMENRQTRRFIQ